MLRRSSRVVERALAVAALAALVLAACGPPETDDDALRTEGGDPLYRDGTYAAAFSHTDPEGWRPVLQVRVRAGLIDRVCFDAVRVDGTRLRDDEAYLERFRLEHGVELLAMIDASIERLIAVQRAPTGAEARTLAWSATFEVLAREALDAARFGLTVEAAGVEQIATQGPYRAFDSPDELGWRAELILTYDDDGIAAASYRETRRELDGTRRDKASDADYQARFRAARGVTTDDVVAALVGQLLAADGAAIDGVSGATLTSTRFRALARAINENRVAAELPTRLCR